MVNQSDARMAADAAFDDCDSGQVVVDSDAEVYDDGESLWVKAWIEVPERDAARLRARAVQERAAETAPRRLGWLGWLDASPARQREGQHAAAIVLAREGLARARWGDHLTARELIVQAVRAAKMAETIEPERGSHGTQQDQNGRNQGRVSGEVDR